jgi:hypothetical protein
MPPSPECYPLVSHVSGQEVVPYADVLEHPPVQQRGRLVAASSINRDVELYRRRYIAELGVVDVRPTRKLSWQLMNVVRSYPASKERDRQTGAEQ